MDSVTRSFLTAQLAGSLDGPDRILDAAFLAASADVMALDAGRLRDALRLALADPANSGVRNSLLVETLAEVSASLLEAAEGSLRSLARAVQEQTP